MCKSKIVTCPVCKKKTDWDAEPKGPFCSERCKLVDLGHWLDGDYHIEGATPFEMTPEEAEALTDPEKRFN